MSVVNSVETVWLIEDNELKKTNKLVSKLNYKGMELAVLKTELDNYNQDVLIKDQNNEYWKMNIIRISFDNFAKAINDNTDISNTRYCNEVMRYFSQKSIEGYFAKKIANTDFVIDEALQTIDFKMDNKGVKLKSEGALVMQMSLMPVEKKEYRNFYFDDTFVLYLIEKEKPYFALRVANFEGLKR